MSAPRLEGSKAKRNRAEAHLKALERLINDFLDGNPYPLVVDPYPEQGRYLVKIMEPKPLPARDIALIIGDCVHNMRCALDYIAWEFAGADSADRDTMFPLFADREKYKGHGMRRIKKLPESARTLIERMQPYNAAADPKQTALWAIDHLDAADKHKLLTVTVPITGKLLVRFRDGVKGVKARVEIHDPSFLEHDTVIAKVTLSPPTPQMKLELQFTPQIAFGDDGEIGRGRFVIPNLERMLRDVDKAIAGFTRL